MTIKKEKSWMTPIVQYLKTGILQPDRKEAKITERHSAYFFLESDQLYKKSFALLSLRCLTPDEANYVLREIHEGICGSHLAGMTIALKAIRSGYYWLTMKKDAMNLVKSYDKCQRFARVQKQPTSEQRPITVPWPFD